MIIIKFLWHFFINILYSGQKKKLEYSEVEPSKLPGMRVMPNRFDQYRCVMNWHMKDNDPSYLEFKNHRYPRKRSWQIHFLRAYSNVIRDNDCGRNPMRSACYIGSKEVPLCNADCRRELIPLSQTLGVSALGITDDLVYPEFRGRTHHGAATFLSIFISYYASSKSIRLTGQRCYAGFKALQAVSARINSAFYRLRKGTESSARCIPPYPRERIHRKYHDIERTRLPIWASNQEADWLSILAKG